MTLTQQLDALIAEHDLSSITLTRLKLSDGRSIWGINAQGNHMIGSGDRYRDDPAKGLSAAIEDLNAKRRTEVVVPMLEAA